MNENVYEGHTESYNVTDKEMLIGRYTVCLISSAVKLIIDPKEQFVR